ncbi:MAG: hypothetical protein AVDCRST_MAG08-4318 [uncultured Acetobacteraceae bacterium]|uniref:Uncharacterized protein n=1 Tax=uncultured Acetobacteraceae bacterium TaxID=169975 RepID=A0A6J4JTN6_9PROT|nr:MAG: hypothetical protein AVDCRST_MAG08-4318 [uncultured Acetobacteraceae bacterium]
MGATARRTRSSAAVARVRRKSADWVFSLRGSRGVIRKRHRASAREPFKCSDPEGQAFAAG